MQQALLITNTHAGQRQLKRRREVTQLCELLRAGDIELQVHETSGPHDATTAAENAVRRGVDRIIVSGGDGTINEAVQGLAGSPVHMGVWPSGTANVLGRELKLPTSPKRVAAALLNGKTERMHLGQAIDDTHGTRRYFFLMAGIGLDAAVVNKVRPALKRRLGKVAFWYAGLEELAHWEPIPFWLEVAGKEYRGTFAAVGNSPHYGGNLAITPRARLDQPEFEICIIDTDNRLQYLKLLPFALFGGLSESIPEITYLRTTKVRAYGSQALVQADGEIIGSLPMTFEVAPCWIDVIVE